MSRSSWTPHTLPRLHGKCIVVTGANSGIGFEATRALANLGARVVLACRNQAAANAAIARIEDERALIPTTSWRPSLSFVPLDLADLASVRACAAKILSDHPHLDVLVNNAGVMALPYRKTADGFEMQFGTNHLGHFALTGLLLDGLRRSQEARVVTVSSLVHAIGTIRFEDLQSEQGYSRWRAYGQSKLANLLFAFELHRRLEARGISVRSLACHPGYASTNLQLAGAQMDGASFRVRMWTWLNRLLAQSSAMGAAPTIFAAASENAKGGEFIGPSRSFGLRGSPTQSWSTARSRDPVLAARLWDASETLTGVRYRDALA